MNTKWKCQRCKELFDEYRDANECCDRSIIQCYVCGTHYEIVAAAMRCCAPIKVCANCNCTPGTYHRCWQSAATNKNEVQNA